MPTEPDAKTLVAPPPPGDAPSPLAATLIASAYGPAVDPEPSSLDDGAFTHRYEPISLLGEGGMGEVRLCKDVRIGREVAVKMIRPGHGSRSDLKKRFLREARVQGQLEHPSIVPVYDLELTPAPAYFTMKRVRGVTVAEVLDRLRRSEADTLTVYSRRKLLTAFGSVCLAVDFAHSRGVFHRDLKPDNIMLGHFGEVYVLDWGIAKVGGADESAEPVNLEEPDAAGKTIAGALMGTPGYMAPEQIRGETVDPRADVYALGAILFELLTYEPLHSAKDAAHIAASTLSGVEARASVRAPSRDVPPELETIYLKATALDPKDRHASARELNQAIERYLDGDRDLEQRRSMAEGHAEAARRAALEALGEGRSPEARSTALREVGRALALDPSNADALKTMVALLVEPPRELPPSAIADLENARHDLLRAGGRAGIYVYAAWLLYTPLLLWMGVRDVWPVALALSFTALAGVFSSQVAKTGSEAAYYAVAVCNTLAAAFLSRLFGPLIFVPTIALAISAGFSLDVKRRRYRIATALALLSFLGPVALEAAGVVSPSYAFRDGVMIVLPHMVGLREAPTLVSLSIFSVAIILTVLAYTGRLVRGLADAERRLLLHAWQLAQLVPPGAQRSPPSR